MTARLTLDGLDLMGIPDPRGFRLKALGSARGTSWGTPEAVTETMDSFLADGAIVATTGHSTRELSLAVAVQAASSAGLAAGEGALIEACRKTWDPAGMIEATWTPPDGMAPTSVFEVVDAQLSQDLDDYSELKPDLLGRVYTLTLTAWPWSRSVEPTRISIPAPASELVETPVDDGSSTSGWSTSPLPSVMIDSGDSTTGWSATAGWALTASGGAVRVSRSLAKAATASVDMVRSGLSVSTAGRPYVRVSVTRGGNVWWRETFVLVNGTIATVVRTQDDAVWVRVPAGVSTVASVNVSQTCTAAQATTAAVAVWDVQSTASTAVDVDLSSTGSRVEVAVGKLGQGIIVGPAQVDLTRSGLSVDMTDTPYLQILRGHTVTSGAAGVIAGEVYLNGSSTPAPVVAASGSVIWVDAEGIDTLASVRLKHVLGGSLGSPSSSVTLWVEDITATNTALGVGTNRMVSRVVPVQGVVRTPASLALHDDTGAGLGTTLVYTCPVIEGMALPPLRPYLVPGPTITPNTTTLSGATSDLSTTHVFEVPAASLQPGVHQLLARVKHTSGGAKTITWSTATLMGATSTPGQSGSVTVTLAADTWTLVPLGLAQLPDRAVGASGMVRVSLSSTSGVLLDDAFAVNLEVGRLTWCECGEGDADLGGPSSWLWADAASLERPVPSVWVSASDNRADAMHAGSGLLALGAHEFAPAQTLVWTATTGSQACAIDLEYYRRWHTHAAA